MLCEVLEPRAGTNADLLCEVFGMRDAGTRAWLMRESAIESLGSVRYVPGMVNGTPTPLRLYEDTVTTLPYQTTFPPSAQPAQAGFSVGHLACK